MLGGAVAATLLLVSCDAQRGPGAHPLLTALAAPPVAAPPGGYDFFSRPEPRDPWSIRIGRWQLRQRAAYRAGLIRPFPTLPAVAGPGRAAPVAARASERSLAARYEAFMDARRREMAKSVVGWVQAEAETRFVDDGPVDHWPTLPEVLAANGDDCDGLELLSYHALRQLGFPEDRVYRAILRRPRFDQHHMVTLWFEDLGDPWVLDPTATITSHLRRLSELDEWVPLKVFSEDREYTVTAR